MKPVKIFSTEWALRFGAFSAAFFAGVVSSDLGTWWKPLIPIMVGIIIHDWLSDKLRLKARVEALKEARQIVKDVRSGR